jgi:hypothetical protein
MVRTRAFRRGLAIVIVAVTAAASVGATPTSAGATPALESAPSVPSSEGHFAPYPGNAAAPTAESGDITAGSCTYRQAIDNPHISGGDTSIHGWWRNIAGTCPALANVDVYLQAFWCDPFGCLWVTVAFGTGDFLAGGGAGRRAKRATDVREQQLGWLARPGRCRPARSC